MCTGCDVVCWLVDVCVCVCVYVYVCGAFGYSSFKIMKFVVMGRVLSVCTFVVSLTLV